MLIYMEVLGSSRGEVSMLALNKALRMFAHRKEHKLERSLLDKLRPCLDNERMALNGLRRGLLIVVAIDDFTERIIALLES